MCELIGLFRTEGPRLLALISEAVESRDAVALQRAAHALKGSASSMAAQLSTEMAQEMEIMGRDSRMDEAPQALLGLELELARVYTTLEGLANAA
jgi:HPt (histidine-containing phosphotransfer) domain-containing protein